MSEEDVPDDTKKALNNLDQCTLPPIRFVIIPCTNGKFGDAEEIRCPKVTYKIFERQVNEVLNAGEPVIIIHSCVTPVDQPMFIQLNFNPSDNKEVADVFAAVSQFLDGLNVPRLDHTSSECKEFHLKWLEKKYKFRYDSGSLDRQT